MSSGKKVAQEAVDNYNKQIEANQRESQSINRDYQDHTRLKIMHLNQIKEIKLERPVKKHSLASSPVTRGNGTFRKLPNKTVAYLNNSDTIQEQARENVSDGSSFSMETKSNRESLKNSSFNYLHNPISYYNQSGEFKNLTSEMMHPPFTSKFKKKLERAAKKMGVKDFTIQNNGPVITKSINLSNN